MAGSKYEHHSLCGERDDQHLLSLPKKLWLICCTILPIVQAIKASIINWDGYIYIYIYTNALQFAHCDYSPYLTVRQLEGQ